ncbi:MAG TPA: class I SAM-dependent methyltransferase [Rhizomicrobium sp.]|jgi:SAM-dependent methyltransferase|nr:class I SAM-dependent methyltransferase [Rhizomicrobium sp.]
MRERNERATIFDDADVAHFYAHRPPYAPALYEFLLGLVPRRRVLVDLGCGPGKIAAALADDFEQVLAIDPAGAMIGEARALYGVSKTNIAWRHARAEDTALPDAIDLITAGTAIHWMAHEILFPKLAERTNLVAIVTGDAPINPLWQDAWRATMTAWLNRLHGIAYDETAFAADGQRYEPWLDIAGRRDFTFAYRQSVEDFIACQHSRASWSRTLMGETLSAEFDRDLAALLRPFAKDGQLTLNLTSTLVWGAPRLSAA